MWWCATVIARLGLRVERSRPERQQASEKESSHGRNNIATPDFDPFAFKLLHGRECVTARALRPPLRYRARYTDVGTRLHPRARNAARERDRDRSRATRGRERR